MPHKGPVQKHPVVSDLVYGSPLMSQPVNKALLDGKKSTAECIVYDALKLCEEKTGTGPVLILKRVIENVKPAPEIRSRHVGDAIYQVPVEVHPGCNTTLALCWLPMLSRQRRKNTMTERLANEALDASNGLGTSVRHREDAHKMAEVNHALVHYR